MEKVKSKLFSAAIGASSGILPISYCYGNTCSSCFRCVGVGIGILLMISLSKLKNAWSSTRNPSVKGGFFISNG